MPGSAVPEKVRGFVLDQFENELQRYRAVIESPDTPVRGLEIITNDPRAVPYFEDMLNKHDIVGRVVVRP